MALKDMISKYGIPGGNPQKRDGASFINDVHVQGGAHVMDKDGNPHTSLDIKNVEILKYAPSK